MIIYHFLGTTAFTRSPISIIDVFFSAIINSIVTVRAERICMKGCTPLPTPTIKRPTACPVAEPTIMLTIEIPMYLATTRSDQINDRHAELTNAIRVEIAAPRIA